MVKMQITLEKEFGKARIRFIASDTAKHENMGKA